MTPHPLLIKLVEYAANHGTFTTNRQIYLALRHLGSTEDEAHTLMWEIQYVW